MTALTCVLRSTAFFILDKYGMPYQPQRPFLGVDPKIESLELKELFFRHYSLRLTRSLEEAQDQKRLMGFGGTITLFGASQVSKVSASGEGDGDGSRENACEKDSTDSDGSIPLSSKKEISAAGTESASDLEIVASATAPNQSLDNSYILKKGLSKREKQRKYCRLGDRVDIRKSMGRANLSNPAEALELLISGKNCELDPPASSPNPTLTADGVKKSSNNSCNVGSDGGASSITSTVAGGDGASDKFEIRFTRVVRKRRPVKISKRATSSGVLSCAGRFPESSSSSSEGREDESRN